MQNSNSVITKAVDGIGVRLAEICEVSVARLYQRLEANHYGKVKSLIKKIALIDKDRVRIIKADLDAMFAEIFGGEVPAEVKCSKMSTELHEAIQSRLEGKPDGEQLKECREAVACLNQQIAYLEDRLERREVQHQVFGDLRANAIN